MSKYIALVLLLGITNSFALSQKEQMNVDVAKVIAEKTNELNKLHRNQTYLYINSNKVSIPIQPTPITEVN